MADGPLRTSLKHSFKPITPVVILVATLAMVTAACTGNDAARTTSAAPDDRPNAAPRSGDTLTVYSRTRDRELFQLFERATGIRVLVRWGNLDDLTDQIIAGGAGSPADVYYAPLSDSLGRVSAAGRLARLSDRQLEQVPEAYRSPDGTWVGTSGRAHAVLYNTDKLSEDDLPDSILGFTDPAWRGRIGWDPNNRSLQGAITALGQRDGEDTARQWLTGIQANAPAVFDGPRPIVNAVAAGQIIDVGFGNHYYLYELQAEGDATNVAARYYGGDPGGLLQVAGVGIVKGTDNQAAASAFVDFLLSPAAQRYMAAKNREIPLVKGIRRPGGTPRADELTVPGLDTRQLEDLQSTRDLLTDAGIIK
jgi:iron(III) transport system substrate-binding protein